MTEMMIKNNNSSKCLRIIYRHQFGLITRVKVGPNKNTAEGSLFDIFNIFASYYNICYSLTFHDITNGPYYGNLDTVTKTFNGSFGSIQKNEHDMLLIPLFGNEDRYRYFDFSSFYSVTAWGALLAYPTVKPNHAGFFQIFDYISWTALGCSIILGLVLRVTSKKVTKTLHRTYEKFGLNGIVKTVGDDFIIILGMLLGQGVASKRTKHSSSNLFICLWIFSTLLLNFFYKSVLLSIFVAPKINIPFTNVYEMVEQEEVKWNLLPGSILYEAVEAAFPNSTLGKIFSKSGEHMKDVSDYAKPEYFKKIRQGKLTLIMPESIIAKTITLLLGKNNNCVYSTMKEPFFSAPTFYMLRKGLNATIKALLSKTITRIGEAGILEHIFVKDIRPSVFHCLSSAGKRENSLRTLQVEDFLGLFGLLLTGFTLAGIAFAVELLTGRRNPLNCFSTTRNK